MDGVKLNWVDRTVGFFNPVKGMQRAAARMRLQAASEFGYIVPGGPQKSMKGLGGMRANSPALDIDSKVEDSRALARDLSMNTSLATSIYRRYKTNVVGAGLQVQPRVDKKFLGLTDEQAEMWTEYAIREFDLWAGALEAESGGSMNFYEMQGLLLLSYLINGDVFFALPWMKSERSGWPYETTVKIIDADLVRTPNENYNGVSKSTFAKIRNGVEYDENGRLAAYWIANYYKRDGWGNGSDNEEFKRIPIYDDEGERQIFHIMDNERIHQRRGLPMLAPVVEDLKNLTRLSKSELMSALVASMFTVFIKDQTAQGGLLQEGFTPDEVKTGGGGEGPDAPQEAKTEGSEWDYEMGHANITYLDEDKEIQIAETRKKSEFDPFFSAMVRNVSAAAEIPSDIVQLHFNKSYSALQGAKLEAGKKWRAARALLANRFCQPCYEAVIREAIIKQRTSAPQFFDDPIYRAAWTRSSWVGAGQGYLDPLKEARAAIININAALSTHEEEYAKATGGRWLPMVERLEQENEKLAELGIDTSAVKLPTITRESDEEE